ncbi:MAG: hypothetical protein LBP87_04455 [Planctomycetaceae bacterium]|jgi:hypothetical protein|nr:hypothetical protein [Planctomycetaceae bacterium]
MSYFSNNYSDYSNNGAEFDSVTIPLKLRELVDQELEEGETIEWIDQPIPHLFPKEIFPIFLFAIVWTSFVIFVMLQQFGNIFNFSFLIPFMFVGVGLLLVPFWRYRTILRTVYVITNRRVIILEGRMFSFDIISYEADEIDEIHRKQKKNGTGNVFVFTNIRNVKMVEQKLRKLKNRTKQNNSE